jgi:hypothetical protein
MSDIKECAARNSMIKLRGDAIDRGMTELAVAYGWSAIRLGGEWLAKAPRRQKDKPNE